MNERRQDPKPHWLRKPLPGRPGYERIRSLVRHNNLHTVCQEARCPNLWECFSRNTATFLILGKTCTRNCRFCAVQSGLPEPPDPHEPERVAHAAQVMNIRHSVVTSVSRDDLPDGGASRFVATIEAIRRHTGPDAAVEVLIPDFQGKRDALELVLRADPAVLNHNIETVPRLYPLLRPAASYRRSLRLLERAAAHNPDRPVKTGVMVGLGETEEELRQTLEDIRAAGARILTLGQYLQPAPDKHPVHRFVQPAEFDRWKAEALSMGFSAVASAPFVRSSFNAAALWAEATKR